MEELDKDVAIPNRITGGPGGPAISVEGSSRFGERETVCVSLEPEACTAETELVAGSFGLCISAVAGCDRGGRTDDACAGTAVYASGDQAEARGGRTGKRETECARGMAKSQASIFAGDEIDALMHDFNHMAERHGIRSQRGIARPRPRARQPRRHQAQRCAAAGRG